ncbi:sigma-70 family RNA polymerase sigma factor [Fuerstiella marisgermanici]|uniref:sigma-70 family RNA polymerase sigma factor n=1 Tax=Fuerstiella marisgermanici TaxID=1891926 RepID=UPI00097C4C38|nr:sigma-70 family RNA polymerase sigma factor [Fuerstiella marisgermanici]
MEAKLAPEEISFIPNDQFQSMSEPDFDEIDGALYVDEDDRLVSPDQKTVAETLLNAIEDSRLLTFEGEQFLFKRFNFLRFRASALQATLTGKRSDRKTQKEIDRLLAEATESQQQVACANLRLATSIARKLAKSPNDFEDYQAEAYTILLKAIDKFDYSRGYRFSTYETHAIQRHLFRYAERNQKQSYRVNANSDAISGAATDTPDPDEPTEQDVNEAIELIVASFDHALDERERFIVRARFGLDGTGKGKTLREIAEVAGLSKERVRQLIQQSLEKLAEVAQPLASTFGPDTDK